MENTDSSRLGLSFDDILLYPDYAAFTRQEIDLTTQLSKHIRLTIPLVSAPMDTVTESSLASALAACGGIGFIHRNLSIDDQCKEVGRVRHENLLVGAAVGASEGFEKRVEALMKADVSVILVDSAHGYTKTVIEAVTWIKNHTKIDVIAGNIATSEGAKALIDAGADGLRVGMGPGAICTTRIISGMGVPQVTAIKEVTKIAKAHNIPVIADGGIKYSGDMVKALALGAQTVMMGSLFAQAIESPGNVVILSKEKIPSRFSHIIHKDKTDYQFKEYRGMGSIGAMEKGREVKSEDEFHGKSYGKDRVLVAEGVEGLVPVKGSVKDIVMQAVGGIKSGMYYVGGKTLPELQKKVQFLRITQASLTESHPHDIIITNPGENY